MLFRIDQLKLKEDELKLAKQIHQKMAEQFHSVIKESEKSIEDLALKTKDSSILDISKRLHQQMVDEFNSTIEKSQDTINKVESVLNKQRDHTKYQEGTNTFLPSIACKPC